MDYFKELKLSLEEAIKYRNGDTSKARRRTVTAMIAPSYQPQDISRLRTQLQLSQKGLANVLGVSGRTVEAWEAGRNLPNKTACQLLYLIDKDNTLLDRLIMK